MNRKIKIARVKGKGVKDREVRFNLNVDEIKHIRRCLSFYLRVHPRFSDEEGLSAQIINKFIRFGKMKGRQSSSILKNKMKGRDYICSYEECNCKEDLEIHHIIPLSAYGSNGGKNLQWICNKHHKLFDYKRILKTKIKECEIIKKKIVDIEDSQKRS